MPAPSFDRFYTYDDLTAVLREWADTHPTRFAFESIGQSWEGRDIWLCTVTNTETGPHHEKPAMWIEANIHATELTGATAALHLVHRLLDGYGTDDLVTRCLDTRTMYVVPRLNPDGAEAALSSPPRFVRSSLRPYPRPDIQPGLHDRDIDGDGRILMMRIPDRNGAWKVHPDDPRLLVARDPTEDDEGTTYYRLLDEGEIHDFDGEMIPIAPPLEGLDLNRNFPAEWEPEHRQRGAGPYPTSEPEIRAEVQAIIDRPNIGAYLSYHTYSAVHLRPYSDHPDDHLPTNDLRVYQALGEKATSITGYPAISIFHDFKYDPKIGIRGGSDDWTYDHLGCFSWTTEFWSPMKAAGIEVEHHIDWFRTHPVEDDLALLRWNDEVLDGKGFVDWYPFEHPQLGPVELGGWDGLNAFGNPPPSLMEAEIEPHADFAIHSLMVSPLLRLRRASVTPLGGDAHLVEVVVENSGWLPTNISDKALERKAVRPVEATLLVDDLDGVSIADGSTRRDLGQLSGRVGKAHGLTSWGPGDPTTDRARARWVVEGPAGTEIAYEVVSPRAGVVRGTVTL